MTATQTLQKNRRRSPRRPAKLSLRVTCRPSGSYAGKNLALCLLDVSETGVRILLTRELEPGQEVSVTVDSPNHAKALKLVADVVWSLEAADGNHCVGLRFHKRLSPTDVTRFT